ncbi:MAG TPA: DUF1731 domain-containing protein [Brevibacterium senegalense]|uniref:DUF1731 domain-containing protein n=1 Tax=Brevibacterium senegalense TaxID=1033736 RepID=A0A921SNN5_9MICO|nr:DUF1731 domain-containing protein [Brevibacterium senegalense]
MDSGFEFAHPDIDTALRHIAADTRPGLLPVTLG